MNEGTYVHENLDRAAFTTYGWSEDISDEDILKDLLALNQKMIP